MSQRTLPLRKGVSQGDPVAQDKAIHAVYQELLERGYPREIAVQALGPLWAAFKEGRYDANRSMVGYAVGILRIEEKKELGRLNRLRLTGKMNKTEAQKFYMATARQARTTQIVLDPECKEVALPRLCEALPGIIENHVPEHLRLFARWKWLEEKKSQEISDYILDLTAKIIEHVRRFEGFAEESFPAEHPQYDRESVELGFYRLADKRTKEMNAPERRKIVIAGILSGKIGPITEEDSRWVRDTIDRANDRYIYPAAWKLLVGPMQEKLTREYNTLVAKKGK